MRIVYLDKFVVTHFVNYINNSYLTNIEPLKICHQTFERQKVIYPTLRLPDRSFTEPISLQY